MSRLYLSIDIALSHKSVFFFESVRQEFLWGQRSAHAASSGAKGSSRLLRDPRPRPSACVPCLQLLLWLRSLEPAYLGVS